VRERLRPGRPRALSRDDYPRPVDGYETMTLADKG